MPRKKYYRLTATAERDFRQAKQWSLSRWSKEQTKQYFSGSHQKVNYIAQNQQAIVEREIVSLENNLGVYPVREHYIVYFPVKTDLIIVVALVRQSRDLPTILKTNHYKIRREIEEITTRL